MTSVRRATPDDAEALVRLRVVMLEAMGVDASDDGWRARAEQRFRELLDDTGSFAAYVGLTDDDTVVASGAAWIDRRIPGPGNGGDIGTIASMATDPEHRGRGHGGAIFAALMDWLKSRDVRRVDLYATGQGESIYRAAGFREPTWPALVWTHPDVTI